MVGGSGGVLCHSPASCWPIKKAHLYDSHLLPEWDSFSLGRLPRAGIAALIAQHPGIYLAVHSNCHKRFTRIVQSLNNLQERENSQTLSPQRRVPFAAGRERRWLAPELCAPECLPCCFFSITSNTPHCSHMATRLLGPALPRFAFASSGNNTAFRLR